MDIFYKAIMADAELAPFFEGIDMAKQRRKQVTFRDCTIQAHPGNAFVTAMLHRKGGEGHNQGGMRYLAGKQLYENIYAKCMYALSDP